MTDLMPLADLCLKITKGTTPSAKDGGFSVRGINYIKSESLSYDGSVDASKFAFISEETNRRLQRSIIQEGDILYSIAGVNLGKCGIARSEHLPANTNQAVAIIRVNENRASHRFISFCLRNPSFVQSVLGGVAQSAQPNVNLADIGRFRIPNLPLPEQCAIASILGALDDKIELNRRMNETLEAMGRAIFQDWFVTFGPTRAKMEGRPPYLAPDLWSLFPDRLDAEGKPEGWCASTIGEEVTVVGGTTPSTKEPAFWNGDLHWATPKDLSSLAVPVLLDTERRITAKGLSQIGSGLLPVGSVLLSSRAPIGYLAVNLVPTAINQGFIGMVCERRLSNMFVWLWTKANMEVILQKANGSTFQEISKSNFRPIPVVVPGKVALGAFEAAVRPIWDRLCANVREQGSLATTRDLLLPRLMSGELRVKDAERVVETAA